MNLNYNETGVHVSSGIGDMGLTYYLDNYLDGYFIGYTRITHHRFKEKPWHSKKYSVKSLKKM